MFATLYIQYFLGQLLILLFGYNLFKQIIIGYLLGLISLSLIVVILFRFIPGYTYNVLFIILGISFFYFFFKKKYIKLLKTTNKNLKLILLFFIVNIFFLILFKNLHFKYLVYEAHDVVYWSPSIELYYSDYLGNIKNFTYYPAKLTAHPLFPTSILSVSAILVNDLNLVTLLEIRYLIVATFFSIICIFFYLNYKNLKFQEYLKIFLIFIVLIYTFENYIIYSLLNSGLILTLFFLIFLMNIENEEINYVKFNSYLSLVLLVCKPGIIFIFLIFPIYYYIKYEYVRNDKIFYIFSILVFLNILTWIIFQKPEANSKISIFNPFELTEYFQTLLLNGWIILGNTFNKFAELDNIGYIINFDKNETNIKNIFNAYTLQTEKINYDLLKFFIIFVFFFLVPFFLILRSFDKKKYLYTLFLIISFLTLFFIRNENIFGNKSVSQVAHIIYILPVFIITIFFKSFLYKKNFNINFVTVIIYFLLFSNFNLNLGSKTILKRSIQKESVRYSDFLDTKNSLKIEKNFLHNFQVHNKEDLSKIEIYSLMIGKRIKRSEYDNLDVSMRSIMMNWSIDRSHDYIWNNKVIKK